MSNDFQKAVENYDIQGDKDNFFNRAFGNCNGIYELSLGGIGYFDAPASKGHHLAERGGLLKHSVYVTRRLIALTNSYSVFWPRKESPYLVGMLHDLVKCRCYRAVTGAAQDEAPSWEYVQPEYHGHGACSVAIAAELGIQLMREEIAAIMFHMGPWGVDKEYSEGEFRAAMKAFAPQIIATHTADWYAAEVDEREVKS
jgi:hypothetical protein